MKAKRLQVAWLLVGLLTPAGAAGQDRSPEPASPEQGRRDEAEREAELFGGAESDASPREAEIFAADPKTPAASPSPTSNREADMFGGEEDNPYQDEESRESSLFGSDESSAADSDDGLEDRMADALAELDERTDLGGQIYLRLDYNTSPARYRRDDEGESLVDEQLQSPNLADFYLDARPTERLRAFVRGRYRYDFTVRSDSRILGQPVERDSIGLDQLWLKFDLFEWAYFTVGQQPIRWGSGRFWNPTDFLNGQTRDPLAVFDERAGVNLVKVHIPIESLGWNFYAVANVDGASRPEDIGGAVRGEILFAETEIAVSVAYRNNNPFQVGLDVTTGFWLVDLRAEIALTYGLSLPFWAGDFGFDFDNFALVTPRQRLRDEDLILQGVAGAEITFNYTDEDALIIGIEYFFNDLGYKTNKLYPWLVLNGQFDPLLVGRHYVAAYLVLAAPFSFDDSTILLSGLGNLSDRSFLTRLDYRVRILTLLDFYLYGMLHFGDEGVFRFGLSGIALPPDTGDLPPDLPPLDNATREALARGQPTALFEAGLGLRVTF